MNNSFYRGIAVILILLISTLLLPSCTTDSTDDGNGGSPGGTGDAAKFKTALEEKGFTVEEGEMKYVDLFQLCSEGKIPSCYGNNADNPYLVTFLPQAPGEVVPDNTSWIGQFQLRPDEAFVIVGKTPPQMTYFSYRSYLLKRYYEEDGGYRLIFASLGDSNNNLTVKTSGTPDGTSGNPYNADTMIISTADRGTDGKVREAAMSAGYSSSLINTDVIPSSMLKMGLGVGYDTFSFVHRIAQFGNQEECLQYRDNPPVKVFRIRPQVQAALNPFTTPELRTRGNGTTEMDYVDAMEDLRQAILTKYSDLEAKELDTFQGIPEGYEAIQTGSNALGDNRDTVYLATDSFLLPNNKDSFVIVYGINHTEVGKSSYSNITVYGMQYLNGVGGASNLDFPGSAAYYLPDNKMAKYLYAWKIARQADGHPYCYEVPYGQDAYGVELTEAMKVAARAYLEKETKTGPAYVELLWDKAIKFSPR